MRLGDRRSGRALRWARTRADVAPARADDEARQEIAPEAERGDEDADRGVRDQRKQDPAENAEERDRDAVDDREPRPWRKTLGGSTRRSEERRVGKECRSRWSPY